MLAEESKEVYNRLSLFSKVNRLAVSFYNSNPEHNPMAPIDLDNEDVISFLSDLSTSGVQYLLVGGFAVAFHGLVRATHDLDLWISADDQNLSKLKKLLIKHGNEALANTRTFDLIPGFTQFAIGNSGFLVDPMKNLKAFGTYDFAQCYQRAVEGTYKGVRFKVINKDDLLREKEANNRPKDQGDIEYLRSLKK